MRTLITLLLCAPLVLATETIDGTNPPNPAKFAWNGTTKTATLLVDLTEPVVIAGAGVTLDGDGSDTGDPFVCPTPLGHHRPDPGRGRVDRLADGYSGHVSYLPMFPPSAAAGAQRPLKTGSRFSTNARIASFESSVLPSSPVMLCSKR